MQYSLPLPCAMLLAFSFLGAQAVDAQAVWSGSAVSFSKPAGGSANLPANQDRITSQTTITRGLSQGIFNIQMEASFGSGSPANTEWAFDLTGNGNTGLSMVASNHAALSFEDWRSAVNANPPGSVGLPGVLHLIAEDIYLDIMFTGWGAGSGNGSFAYTRAGEPASQVVRNAGSNPASLTTGNAVIGLPIVAQVDLSTTGHSMAIIYLFSNPANAVLGNGQVLLVGGALIGNLGSQAGPLATFNGAVPNDLSIVGTTLSMQAAHLGGVMPFALSNAVDLTAGF